MKLTKEMRYAVLFAEAKKALDGGLYSSGIELLWRAGQYGTKEQREAMKPLVEQAERNREAACDR